MHPILFRIPLLKGTPIKYWWALAAVVAIALVYGLIAQRKANREGALTAFAVAVGAGVLAYVLRDKAFASAELPIYSYGVMLGLSLIVGWYLTLGLADREGLPKEVMANCYVVTAIAALVGSRVLYVLTNLDEFQSLGDLFAMRRGGLVAYGGFIGGFLGSWGYLASQKIRLLPWADIAVPSLAAGLFITRVGCYLFGCDFGKRLPEGAPAFLKTLGTFPHWSTGTLDAGEGSPAYVRHLEQFRGTELGAQLVRDNHSLPVHPTPIYEALAGLALLGLLLWQRKHQKFRGQIFFLFAFAYGFVRFLIEILRDDVERGTYGPIMSEHVLIPAALVVFSLAFVFGIALGIENPKARTAARVAAIFPPIIAYLVLKPASFGGSVAVQLSTSQLIGVITAAAVAFYYAKFWQDAMVRPKAAMNLELPPEFATTRKPPGVRARDDRDEDDDERDESATHVEAPVAKKRRARSNAELAEQTEEMRVDPEPTEEMRLDEGARTEEIRVGAPEKSENIMASLREATEPMAVATKPDEDEA
jgi:phosphatidylglycerol:prolipoprotein diacylglycerol transferase